MQLLLVKYGQVSIGRKSDLVKPKKEKNDGGLTFRDDSDKDGFGSKLSS